MYKNHKISISIPAYNEEKYIVKTLEGIPEFVDFVVITNDCSTDKTKEVVENYINGNPRIHLINRNKNMGGPGQPIMDAHEKGMDLGADILVVINADDQMDLGYLNLLLDKIIDENYDYVKGNRFFHVRDLKKMPKLRLVGNIFVSFLNKFCSGYWSISDPLNGYTAIKVSTYRKIDIDMLAKKYDFESSMFPALAMIEAKLADLFIPAIYKEEVSHVSFFRDTLRVMRVLLKGFFRRMFVKNLIFNMNLVPIYYVLGSLSLLFSLIYGAWVIIETYGTPAATAGTVLLAVVPFIIGVQFILQAITLDIQLEPK